MKIVFLFVILISAMRLFGQNEDFKLPKVWDEDFVISVSHTGSMSGSKSHLTFTYDSCKYVATSLRAKPEEKVFALTQKDRDKILSKMRALKIEDVKVSLDISPQRDGWSHVLCMGWHCIEGGSASGLSQSDRNTFLSACGYLEEFALNK